MAVNEDVTSESIAKYTVQRDVM